MRRAPVVTAIGLTAGLFFVFAFVLHIPFSWATILSAALAFCLLAISLDDRGGERLKRRRTTDHPVTIFEGKPANHFLVALCDVDDCPWMRFAQPGDLDAQENELRAAAAGHTRALVPDVKRWEAG